MGHGSSALYQGIVDNKPIILINKIKINLLRPFEFAICPKPAKEITQGVPKINAAIDVRKFVFKVCEWTILGLRLLKIRISLNRLFIICFHSCFNFHRKMVINKWSFF